MMAMPPPSSILFIKDSLAKILDLLSLCFKNALRNNTEKKQFLDSDRQRYQCIIVCNQITHDVGLKYYSKQLEYNKA